MQHAGGAVPDQPGPQFRELLARVAPGQHVQHGLEDGPGQAGERRGPADHLVQVVHGPVIERGHRHDLLGEHVQRVAGDAQLLDLPAAHPAGHHRGLDQVALVFGEDDAAAHIADVVPGPAGALQAAGHRWG